jgi:hypothetical protein
VATVGGLLEAVFSVGSAPGLCNEDTSRTLVGERESSVVS